MLRDQHPLLPTIARGTADVTDHQLDPREFFQQLTNGQVVFRGANVHVEDEGAPKLVESGEDSTLVVAVEAEIRSEAPRRRHLDLEAGHPRLDQAIEVIGSVRRVHSTEVGKAGETIRPGLDRVE